MEVGRWGGVTLGGGKGRVEESRSRVEELVEPHFTFCLDAKGGREGHAVGREGER